MPLKNSCKISHTLRPNREAGICEKPGSDTFADLAEPPGEAGGNHDKPQQILTLVAAIFES